MELDLHKFKHKFQVRVRNYEVDSQSVVHNAVYLEYCEAARFEYIRQFGVKLLPGGTFGDQMKVMIKRNEITYYNPARLDDLLDVYSRIAYIKNTSFCFEHILLNHDTSQLICFEKAVHVNLNPFTNEPEKITGEYRKLFRKFEGDDLKLMEN
jgi:acyl-CoA thioester hydrolase